MDIKSQTLEELQSQMAAWQEPAYRAAQVMEWLYGRRATDWDAMSNLPKELRQRLRRHYELGVLAVVRLQGSRDSTQKFLWRLRDQSLIESVLIPANPSLYGEVTDRYTLCLSTQVGCAYGCKFCASGLDGWKRNLEPDEMVEQVMAVERWHLETKAQDNEVPGTKAPPAQAASDPRLISNLVIMGMGEPLANYANLLKALRILNAPWGGGVGARKVTISTSGLAPQIHRLADEPFQFRLAVSLHGATDAVRDRIMPVNRKYPLAELADACDYYQQKKGRMITFEYILLAGVNDGLEQARPLAELARRLNAKVNLIPYNHVDGLEWDRPSEEAQEAFLRALEQQGASVTLRREKGHEIEAACGQLRLRTERQPGGGR